jgi:hypothetical protein
MRRPGPWPNKTPPFAFTTSVLGAAALAMLYFSVGFLRDYTVLLGSLTAYGVSAVVCVAMSLPSRERFDFNLIAEHVVSFHRESRTADARTDAPAPRGGRITTRPA